MTRRQKDPLRPLSEEERSALERLSRAQSEPSSHVARARLVLAVAAGQSYTAAARGVGRRSGDAVPGVAAGPGRAAGGERGHHPGRAARRWAAVAAQPQLV